MNERLFPLHYIDNNVLQIDKRSATSCIIRSCRSYFQLILKYVYERNLHFKFILFCLVAIQSVSQFEYFEIKKFIIIVNINLFVLNFTFFFYWGFNGLCIYLLIFVLHIYDCTKTIHFNVLTTKCPKILFDINVKSALYVK